VSEGNTKRKKKTIAAHVKVLNVLKVVRFGTSLGAFEDYFQMSAETVRASHRNFFRIVANHDGLRTRYLRDMTRADAQRVSELISTDGFGT